MSTTLALHTHTNPSILSWCIRCFYVENSIWILIPNCHSPHGTKMAPRFQAISIITAVDLIIHQCVQFLPSSANNQTRFVAGIMGPAFLLSWNLEVPLYCRIIWIAITRHGQGTFTSRIRAEAVLRLETRTLLADLVIRDTFLLRPLLKRMESPLITSFGSKSYVTALVIVKPMAHLFCRSASLHVSLTQYGATKNATCQKGARSHIGWRLLAWYPLKFPTIATTILFLVWSIWLMEQ